MAVITSLITQILGILLQVLGLASVTRGLVQYASQEHSPFSLETIASNGANTVNSPTYGNAALLAAITSAESAVRMDIANLAASVGTPQQATDPVIFPTTPPSGYAPTTADEIAAIVWAYDVGNYGRPMGTLLNWCGADVLERYSLASNGSNGGFYSETKWPLYLQPDNDVLYPTLDPSVITAGNDLLSEVRSQNTSATCSWLDGVGGHVLVEMDGSDNHRRWVTLMDGYEFAQRFSTVVAPGIDARAPVWPGLELVTLGSPIALAEQFAVEGPLHGVLVEITSAPAKQGFFTFDTVVSWRNAGAISFVTDDDQAEAPQNLGFQSEIFTPRYMAVASRVIGRAHSGLTGTITPWLLTVT